MNIPRLCVIIGIITLCLSLLTLPIAAQEEEHDLDLLEMMEEIQEQEQTLEVLETVWAEETSIASRVTTSIEEAPAVVTVITAEQIRDMGVRTLQDVLKIVPGFDAVPYSTLGFNEDLVFGHLRFLVLHNGARTDEYYWGRSAGTEQQIFLENVQRIEIIRGPGSALYGANAFIGVINVITKTPEQIDGVQIGYEHSSMAGMRGYHLAGKQFGDWSAAFFAQYFQDDGQKSFIPADILGQEGYIQDKQMQAIDLDLLVKYKDFSFETRYLRRKPHTFFLNMTRQPSFDENLRQETENFSFYGSYQQEFFNEKGTLNIHTEYKRTTLDIQAAGNYPFQVYYRIPTDDIAGELSFAYALLNQNTVTIGARLGHERAFDRVMKFNFAPETETYLGEWMTVEIPSQNSGSERTIFSVYAEDVWKLSERIQLTIGGRLDNYTQFGNTFNPRFALVYTPVADVSIKVLYGRAFRAPNASEAYDFGTEDLGPEIINMYEVGMSYDLLENWTIRGNYFYAAVDDMIEFREEPDDPDTLFARNVGSILARGFEVELKGTFHLGYGWANYTHINADTETGDPMPTVADHLASVGVNLRFGSYLNLNVWGYYRGERPIEGGESGLTIDSYTNLNLNLRIENLLDKLEGYLTIYNLFDTEYAYSGTKGFSIPARGREVMLGIHYTF